MQYNRKMTTEAKELPHELSGFSSPSTQKPHVGQQRSMLSPQSGFMVSCMIPLKDSPVMQRTSVSVAMPNVSKLAWRVMKSPYDVLVEYQKVSGAGYSSATESC